MKFLYSISWLLLASPGGEAFVPRKQGWVSLDRAVSSVPNTHSPRATSLHLSMESVEQQVEKVLQNTISGLDGMNLEIKQTYETSLAAILAQVQGLISQEQSVQTQVLEYAAKLLQQVQVWLQQYPGAEKVFQQVMAQLQPLVATTGGNTPIVLAVSAVVSYLVISTVLGWNQAPPPSKPYPLQRYDPDAARAYFDDKLVQAVSRTFVIATTTLGFTISLLRDKLDGSWEKKQEQRGMELAKVLTKLGPTFIKIGQSLSIRTDLLSPAYVKGLTTLQDQVPPFDTQQARQILEQEWGRSVDSVLTKLSPEPIAAASLGQVYRGTMKDGREVAIKVQRPNIMNQIALDMHLLREFAPIAKRTFNLNTDTSGTVDAWGLGFIDELDYVQEAANGKRFMEKIQKTPLKDVVLSPAIIDELSTGKVLVTQWIDGERLDKSSKEDINVLCSICMNTYLTMMLELGVLHCDPHPGNLLRTPEGKLCILDWGMVTVLPPELQLTLIEHMAHLTSADYAEVPRDLLLLGFIPEDKADLIEDSGVVEVLADIYGAWTSGGGVAAINVPQVIQNLQDLTAEKGNLFRIPPYFAYIAKSFSVLEGIGLSNDKEYSIINECLPYVSQRLLMDDSSMGPALNTFIFGPEKGNLETRIVDYKRVEQLVTGFGNYTTSASGGLMGKKGMSRREQLEDAADKVFGIVLSEEETPFQEILIEQLAKIVASSSRSVWTQVRERSGMLPSGRTVLGTLVDPLGFFRTSPLVRMNELDEKTVETTRKLIFLLQSQVSADNELLDLSKLERDEVIELSSILVRKVWDKRMGLVKTGNRLATKLLQLTADKLDRGERDTRTLPPSQHNDVMEPEQPPVPSQTKTTDSPRLAAARYRMNDLDGEEVDVIEDLDVIEKLDVIVEDAVPVKFLQ